FKNKPGEPVLSYVERNRKTPIPTKQSKAANTLLPVSHPKGRLPPFLTVIPDAIDFVDELPQTATEKVRKKVLREQGVTETTWDRLA
ncbi:MAG: hypothetical protein VB948_03975, partial [Pseudomonadales bacterium]